MLAKLNHLVKVKKHHKPICLLITLTLLLGLFPLSLQSVNAATKFVGIEIEQKIVVAKVGDKVELKPMGYYYLNLFGDDIDTPCYEDVSNVKWKSSNTKIATVSKKGILTAKAPGKCIITATWGKKKAQCKVRIYTEKELYDKVLDADIAHEDVFMALTTNYYKNYDLLYDTEMFEEVSEKKVQAARKAKEIIDTVVTKDMSDYEKMMAIAEWIVENIQVIDNYKSKFTKANLRTYEKGYYYLDPLLYGKSNEMGIGLLFELLLNVCGIRCELVHDAGSFHTDQGEEIYLTYSNAVELDGAYYYFNIMQLASDMKELREEGNKDYSFYEFIVSENEAVNQFVHITTCMEKEDWIKYGTNPRPTNFDSQGNHNVILGYNLNKISVYSYYFYDFYNEAFRFVTKKEDIANQNISYKPCIPVLPFYPDSTATKYKEIFNIEAAFNSKIVQIANSADTLYQTKLEGNPINSLDISALVSDIAAIETEFASLQSTFANKNLINFMKYKIAETKATITKLQS
ncbi:Ig-like domain-containing protein [Lachnoclostridium sp.]|nr:Ig-like domain-containing protein [Lachnoclostridium sp.]